MEHYYNNWHTLLVCFIPVFSIALTLWTTILSSFLFIFVAKQTKILNTVVTFKITLLLNNSSFKEELLQLKKIIGITWKMNTKKSQNLTAFTDNDIIKLVWKFRSENIAFSETSICTWQKWYSSTDFLCFCFCFFMNNILCLEWKLATVKPKLP